ncbi:MAG: hypothetical protein IIX94_04355, partial [Clostridia bacterium]|nr:hypothetical protein [Clostridia bacterium]
MVKGNIKKENVEFEIRIKDFLDTFKKYWLLIFLVSTLLAVGIYAYFNASFVPTYTADIKICVYNS